jgi:hypothetical protein
MTRDEARAVLAEAMPPGTTVHTILRHVTRSGMTREISPVTIGADGSVRYWTYAAAAVMGSKVGTHGGVKMSGCGMDMGFALVYDLSRTLYPQGFDCTGSQDCPANDHSNDYGTAQRAYYDAHPEDRPISREDRAAYLAAHSRMRDYVDARLSSDLGYQQGRRHSDGGYALRQRWL